MTTATKPEARILAYPTFIAVHVRVAGFVFVAHIFGAATLPAIAKVEIYTVKRGAETFVGYADHERLARMAPAMLAAYEAALPAWRAELAATAARRAERYRVSRHG